MKVIIYDENKKKLRLNKFMDWLIYMIGYAIVLIALSITVKDFNIDNQYFGLYALLATMILYVLNKTIKPIIFWLTLPITALTFGLFYPFVNVINLYIVEFILGDKFVLGSVFNTFLIAILISIMNIIMEQLIIKPFIKEKNNEI